MKECYLYLIASLFLISCNSSDKKKTDIQKDSDVCVINLDEIKKRKTIKTSYFFKSVKTIILETNRNSLIGHIDKLEAYRNYLYVLDNSLAQQLFIFNKQGKFVRTIGEQGSGPGEYRSIADFSIDKENENILLLDDTEQQIYRYDINTGEHIGSIPIRFNEEGYAYSMTLYNGRMYIDAHYQNPDKSNAMIHEINPATGDITNSFLNMHQYNKGESSGLLKKKDAFTSSLYTAPKFVQYMMDTIMIIDGKTVNPFIALKSEHLVTPNFLESHNIRDIKDISPHNYTNYTNFIKEEKVYNIRNYVECNDLILFDYQQGGSVFRVFCNLKKEKTIVSSFMDKDFIYKPDFKESAISYIISADDKGVYEVVQPNIMEYFLDMIQSGGLKEELDQRDELVKLTEDANPVIFYYEYKE